MKSRVFVELDNLGYVQAVKLAVTQEVIDASEGDKAASCAFANACMDSFERHDLGEPKFSSKRGFGREYAKFIWNGNVYTVRIPADVRKWIQQYDLFKRDLGPCPPPCRKVIEGWQHEPVKPRKPYQRKAPALLVGPIVQQPTQKRGPNIRTHYKKLISV